MSYMFLIGMSLIFYKYIYKHPDYPKRWNKLPENYREIFMLHCEIIKNMSHLRILLDCNIGFKLKNVKALFWIRKYNYQ